MAYPGHERGRTGGYDDRSRQNDGRGHGGRTPRGGPGQQRMDDDDRGGPSPPSRGGPSVEAIIHKIQQACKNRGVTGFKDFSRMFRLYDRDGSHNLDKEEFAIGLQRYGVKLTPPEVHVIFDHFDRDGGGTINTQELMYNLRPEMNKCRKEIVEKAFQIIDRTRDGYVTVEDLEKYYKVTDHPKYKSGEWTKKQCLKEFLDVFQADNDDVVTKQEFEDYYHGVSVNIDKDVYFDYMMSMFRLYDSDGSRCLDQEELGIGLSKYGIQLSEDEIQTIFAAFDADSSGSVNMQELLLAIRPPMAPGRVKIVKQAFEKMDRTGDGVITQADLVEFYNIKEHPKFKSGQFTEEQCFKQFLDSFQQNSEVKDDKVTWDEFLDYYVGVSVNIDKDVYFDYMMRQSWKY